MLLLYAVCHHLRRDTTLELPHGLYNTNHHITSHRGETILCCLAMAFIDMANELLESPGSQKPMPPTTRRIYWGVFASESSIIWGVLKMILGESLGLIGLICGGPAIV